MPDVTYDLQLMSQRPSKFLYDLTSTDLPLNQVEISREKELASILVCHQRCISGSCEITIIKGESGTGKSWLAQRVGKCIAEKGGMWLTGKFDQSKQAKPYAVLASVFDQFCDFLMRSKDKNWVKLTVDELKAAIGRDLWHLIKVIPKLRHIIPGSSYSRNSVSDVTDENSLNAVQRLHYLLSQLVEVLSKNSQVALTLYLDDMQWADDASILFLNKLLKQGHKKFFFLGCYREESSGNKDHCNFWKMLETVRCLSDNVTEVEISCLQVDVLNQVMSELLCVSHRVVKPLSDIIYRKTKGNIMFFLQLIQSFSRDGLLQFDNCMKRWVWDEEKTLSAKLPDGVAMCLVNGINKLPLSMQFALHTLSTFGHNAKRKYLDLLESKLNCKLVEPLCLAVEEGLVINLDDSFSFCHDCIQEASYMMLGEKDRHSNHIKYGRCLAEISLRCNAARASLDNIDSDMLFVAVNQLNLGRRCAVSNMDEAMQYGRYNLVAGKKSMEIGDFNCAYNYFDNGLSFLGKNHWRQHYNLSLEIYELAAKCAMASGKTACFRILSDQIFQSAHRFEDTLNIHYIQISMLTNSSKIGMAFENGIGILSKLGVIMPVVPTQEALNREVERTQSLIKGISEDAFLNYRRMTDSKILQAAKFLAQLQVIAFIIKPAMQPFVILQLMQLTALHGLSPASPLGFALFGLFLAKHGNLTAGYKFHKIAKSLLEKSKVSEVNEYSGQVIGMITELQLFVEPAQAASDSRLDAASLLTSEGNIASACIYKLQYCADQFWLGKNLSVVDELFSKAHIFFKQQGHTICLGWLVIGQRAVDILLGKETETLTMNCLSASIGDSANRRHEMLLSFYNLYYSLLISLGDMRECYERFLQLKVDSTFLTAIDATHAFITGLAAFQIYRDKSNSATREQLWVDRGRKQKEAMLVWAEQGSSWNFKHKLSLLEAEEYFSIGNWEQAKESYQRSIATAHAHKFINDEALGCELAAKFYFETGDLSSSLDHFQLAHKKYVEWGAVAKASGIVATINEKFARFQGSI